MKRYSVIFIILTFIGLTLCSIAQEKFTKTGHIDKATIVHNGKTYTVDTPDSAQQRAVIHTAITTAICGIILVMLGCCSQAIARGRSPLWGLWGIFTPLGILIIATLKDKQPNQGMDLTRGDAD